MSSSVRGVGAAGSVARAAAPTPQPLGVSASREARTVEAVACAAGDGNCTPSFASPVYSVACRGSLNEKSSKCFLGGGWLAETPNPPCPHCGRPMFCTDELLVLDLTVASPSPARGTPGGTPDPSGPGVPPNHEGETR